MPLYLLSNLNSLLTLSTLNTLANYGATLRNFNDVVESWFINISKRLLITTNKSNLCQVGMI